MKTPEQIKEDLMQFTGTTTYFKHPFNIKFTDGVKYLADECQCYWLIDLVASYQFDKKVKREDFQVYKLKVNPDKSAIVEISDGNENIIVTQELEFTDFPLEEIMLWFANGVCYLPSEH